ncbi:MAG: hypothetical protein K5634_05170 [Sphaerochaetaceae bacterium]|nr:hypothetical protein [Sphaerochaetaceae bacterium]
MFTDKFSFISDSIIKYQKLIRVSPDSEECAVLKKHITQQLMIAFYFLPQREFSLSEEDASEFVLFVKDSLDSVITSYRGGSFYSYLLKCIRNRLANFYKRKLRDRRKEEVINYDYSLKFISDAGSSYRAGTEEEALRNIEPPGRSPALILLRNIFYSNSLSRKRVFLFLVSSIPLISEENLYYYCKNLSVDYAQTKRIKNFLKENTDRTGKETAMKNLEKLRNDHYLFILQEEIEARNLIIRGEKEKASELMDLVEQRKRLMKSYLIENRVRTLGYSSADLQRVFKVCRGTIASNICIGKRLLTWSLNPKEADLDQVRVLRINCSFFTNSERYLKDVKLPTFYPYSEFPLTDEFKLYRGLL